MKIVLNYKVKNWNEFQFNFSTKMYWEIKSKKCIELQKKIVPIVLIKC